MRMRHDTFQGSHALDSTHAGTKMAPGHLAPRKRGGVSPTRGMRA